MPGSDSSPLHLIPPDDDNDENPTYGYPKRLLGKLDEISKSTPTGEMLVNGSHPVICYCVQIPILRDPATGYCKLCDEGRLTEAQAVAMHIAYAYTLLARATAYGDTPTTKIVNAELFSLLSQAPDGVVNDSHESTMITIRPDHAAPGFYAVYTTPRPMQGDPRRLRILSAMTMADILNWRDNHLDANIHKDEWEIIQPKEQ